MPEWGGMNVTVAKEGLIVDVWAETYTKWEHTETWEKSISEETASAKALGGSALGTLAEE